ncbi:FAS1-like dehydratase domain-containing protein [Aeromicrobium sp. CF3.5]|uniref:FAS1-like dehydratase domain-containing protein n=1 Tax=Aeromicrobium sp. CF3.5 TaxID=3373078 RepID=UPI003EE7F985
MSAPTEPARSETTRLVVEPVAVAALAQLLGADDVDLRDGAPLPISWHWVALARWPDPAILGRDGHERRGHGLIPQIDLPRRMFGGGQISAIGPLPIGSTVDVTTTAGTPRERNGRRGRLVTIDLSIQVHDTSGDLLLEETKNLVYIGRPAPGAPPPVTVVEPQQHLLTAPTDATSSWTLTTDPALLARYSALTANPHRIHLDWPYATAVEGYPGLVVHGPLLATALADVARRSGWGAPRAIEHRGSSPLFCGEAAALVLDEEARGVEVRTTSTDSAEPVVHARLTFTA